MTMNAGAALDAPRAELQDFFDKVRGKVGEIVDDNVRKQFSEALECFVGAFTDPNESFSFDKFIVGILSILEALAETAINLVKFIIDLLFEVVDKLVSWAKTALTAEFPIPLVKDLWYSITKGEPFSALNVVTLAVAIPATVTRKAVTGPSPVHKPAVTDSSISALRATITSNDPDFQRKLTSAIVYSCCSLINGLVSTGLDAMEAGEMIAEPQEIELMGRLPSGRFPPMPTKPGWAKFTVPGSGVLEWVGWITQAGMVVTSWPGGYPFAKMSGFFPEGDPAEGWDSGLWIYETGLAAVDLISMLLPFGKKLRRAGEIQLVIGSILGLGHVLMVLVVMGVELKHKSDWYKAHVVPWKTVQGGLGALSEFLAFLMLPQLTETSEGSTLLAFLATEGVATLSDTGINLYMAIEGLVAPPES